MLQEHVFIKAFLLKTKTICQCDTISTSVWHSNHRALRFQKHILRHYPFVLICSFTHKHLQVFEHVLKRRIDTTTWTNSIEVTKCPSFYLPILIDIGISKVRGTFNFFYRKMSG